MGMVEKSVNDSSGMKPRYDYASQEIHKAFRGRTETVKNAVRSFESLKDISRPFRLSRESLRDISKPVIKSEGSRGSTESLKQKSEYISSLKTTSCSIECTQENSTSSDFFTFSFDLSSPFSSLNSSPVSGSPGKNNQQKYCSRYQELSHT